MNENRCVSCGAIIPEGGQVCTSCKNEKAFTPEDVRNMTVEEVKANYAKIIKDMTLWH